MKSSNNSIIWSINKEKLQFIVNKSSSIKDILNNLNIRPYSWNYKSIQIRMTELDIDINQFNINRNIFRKNLLNKLRLKRKISDEIIFSSKSPYNRAGLKHRILKDELLKYECFKCKNEGLWMNEKLILQLDHINGIYNDNRLENLRFICPNCHTQTETFSVKRFKKKSNCKNCGVETKGYGKHCVKCTSKKIHPKKFEIKKEDLEDLIFDKKIPMTKIGKMFNVSDNAIRKRCKVMCIKLPKKFKRLNVIDSLN